MAREITYNNFEISLVVFMPNITTNHAITYTYKDYSHYTELFDSYFTKSHCLKFDFFEVTVVIFGTFKRSVQ